MLDQEEPRAEVAPELVGHDPHLVPAEARCGLGGPCIVLTRHPHRAAAGAPAVVGFIRVCLGIDELAEVTARSKLLKGVGSIELSIESFVVGRRKAVCLKCVRQRRLDLAPRDLQLGEVVGKLVAVLATRLRSGGFQCLLERLVGSAVIFGTVGVGPGDPDPGIEGDLSARVLCERRLVGGNSLLEPPLQALNRRDFEEQRAPVLRRHHLERR